MCHVTRALSTPIKLNGKIYPAHIPELPFRVLENLSWATIRSPLAVVVLDIKQRKSSCSCVVSRSIILIFSLDGAVITIAGIVAGRSPIDITCGENRIIEVGAGEDGSHLCILLNYD